MQYLLSVQVPDPDAPEAATRAALDEALQAAGLVTVLKLVYLDASDFDNILELHPVVAEQALPDALADLELPEDTEYVPTVLLVEPVAIY